MFHQWLQQGADAIHKQGRVTQKSACAYARNHDTQKRATGEWSKCRDEGGLMGADATYTGLLGVLQVAGARALALLGGNGVQLQLRVRV